MKTFVQILLSVAVTALCLFGSAGRFNWPNAWILLVLNLAAAVTTTVLLASDPALAAERRNTKAGKSWDKPIVFVVVLLGPVATWITSGLDIRFRWSEEMGPMSVIAGVVVALLAIVLIAWAMRANTFFSSVVRIQKDRGHSVISTGPYSFLRHPGYTGFAAFTLATPLILASRWAFLPAAATVAVTVVRTALEDGTLQRELDGYADYARQVRYKLVPMLW